MTFLNPLISRLNNRLYDSRDQALRIIRAIILITSITGMGLVIYIYGFEYDDDVRIWLINSIIVLLVIFILCYLARFLYAFQHAEFLKDTRWEALVLLLASLSIFIFFNSAFHYWFPSLRPEKVKMYSETLITGLLLLLILFEVARALLSIGEVKLRPGVAFVVSFLLLISVGTGLLMLPTMTTQPGSLSVIDALFTSVSASCVTGLIVVDTATDFTLRGQVVILLLMQTGGLGMLTFATFFATLLNSELGIRQTRLIPDYLDNQTLGAARPLLRRIVLLTLMVEGGTFLALMYLWGDYPFDTWGQKVFFSLFHAVSAFCNAGFSLFSNGLYEPIVRNMYLLHTAVALSLILGSLGFSPVYNIFSPRQLRQRLAKPWIDWTLSTKIAVNMAIILLGVGTLGFYWLERTNTLQEMNLAEAMVTSFFQSATTRTAGFNTVDISQLTQPTVVLFMFLMFIGGSSGSTAGGIKTSTFFLLVASVISTSRGSSRVIIGNRYIPNTIIFKALSIFFYGIAINLIGVFILSISEPDLNIIDLTFEQVSAFGTVGVSRGITASLTSVGKVVLIVSMFLGRVGTLTFAVALSTRAASQAYKLPKDELMVG
uniref:Potassium transporter TrkG n=1 Tax=Roseihalotalea indica TaxID=2867963 RepID=A0AA49JHL8_9BACT|nr:potassium transporter TrkG [Tunicatimonas sp. TK19036]